MPRAPGGLSLSCQRSRPGEGPARLRPPARTPQATSPSRGLLFCPVASSPGPALAADPEESGQLQDCLLRGKGPERIPSGFSLEAAEEGEGLILGQ